MHRQLRLRCAQQIQGFFGSRENSLGRDIAKDEETGGKRDARQPHVWIFLTQQNNGRVFKRVILLDRAPQQHLLRDLYDRVNGTHCIDPS
jgi:hypothetical protein